MNKEFYKANEGNINKDILKQKIEEHTLIIKESIRKNEFDAVQLRKYIEMCTLSHSLIGNKYVYRKGSDDISLEILGIPTYEYVNSHKFRYPEARELYVQVSEAIHDNIDIYIDGYLLYYMLTTFGPSNFKVKKINKSVLIKANPLSIEREYEYQKIFLTKDYEKIKKNVEFLYNNIFEPEYTKVQYVMKELKDKETSDEYNQIIDNITRLSKAIHFEVCEVQ